LTLLIHLLIVLLIAGAIVWIARLLVPALGLPPVLAQVITVIVAVAVVVWLLRVLLLADLDLRLPS
jgi:branched-subunit amino acid transport protein